MLDLIPIQARLLTTIGTAAKIPNVQSVCRFLASQMRSVVASMFFARPGLDRIVRFDCVSRSKRIDRGASVTGACCGYLAGNHFAGNHFQSRRGDRRSIGPALTPSGLGVFSARGSQQINHLIRNRCSNDRSAHWVCEASKTPMAYPVQIDLGSANIWTNYDYEKRNADQFGAVRGMPDCDR